MVDVEEEEVDVPSGMHAVPAAITAGLNFLDAN
jgi:hypothetical protein